MFSVPIPSTALWNVWRLIRGPIDSILLLFHGASRMSGSISAAVAFFIIIPAVIFWVLQPLGLVSHEKSIEYVYAFWVFLVLAITFFKPSQYALTGYTKKGVGCVVERMPDLYLCTKRTLTVLQSCLQRAEDDTKSRLITIKWIAGAAFALGLYLGKKGFDLKDGSLISSALLPLTIAAFIAGFIAIHARGTMAVYGLAYAIIYQLEAQFETQQKSRLTRTRWLVRQPIRSTIASVTTTLKQYIFWQILIRSDLRFSSM